MAKINASKTVVRIDVMKYMGLSYIEFSLWRMIYYLSQNYKHGKGYCFATNEYFANELLTSTMTIKRALKKLREFGLISSSVKKRQRHLTPCSFFPDLMDGSADIHPLVAIEGYADFLERNNLVSIIYDSKVKQVSSLEDYSTQDRNTSVELVGYEEHFDPSTKGNILFLNEVKRNNLFHLEEHFDPSTKGVEEHFDPSTFNFDGLEPLVLLRSEALDRPLIIIIYNKRIEDDNSGTTPTAPSLSSQSLFFNGNKKGQTPPNPPSPPAPSLEDPPGPSEDSLDKINQAKKFIEDSIKRRYNSSKLIEMTEGIDGYLDDIIGEFADWWIFEPDTPTSGGHRERNRISKAFATWLDGNSFVGKNLDSVIDSETMESAKETALRAWKKWDCPNVKVPEPTEKDVTNIAKLISKKLLTYDQFKVIRDYVGQKYIRSDWRNLNWVFGKEDRFLRIKEEVFEWKKIRDRQSIDLGKYWRENPIEVP